MATENFEALGTLPNAPLVLVLAQVLFVPSTPNGLEDLRAKVIDALGGEFPHIAPLYLFNVQINAVEGGQPQQLGQQTLTGYDLRSADQRSVIRLSLDSMTLAVNSYKSFESFMETWSRCLASLSTVGISQVSRVGLRYVDFIYPTSSRVPEDYFVPPFDFRGFQPVTGATGTAQTNALIQEFPFEEGRMRVQYARGIGNPALPVELQGLLEVASIHARPWMVGPTAVFDTDRSIDGLRPSDLTSLQQTFELLHTGVSDAFKQFITQSAKDEWSTSREASA